MIPFNRVRVEMIDGFLTIQDSQHLDVTNGSYYIDDGCLIIYVHDEAVVGLPKSHYQEVMIHSIRGDCKLAVSHSVVDYTSFFSETGDLIIARRMHNISFSSKMGRCIYGEHSDTSKKN